jgi:hypothetical protein
MAGQQVQGRLAVAGLDGGVAGVVEDLAQALADERVVVNQEAGRRRVRDVLLSRHGREDQGVDGFMVSS